ncbi:MAG: hypothetical protein JWP44_4224 [Mucilaginibacter sp.]|jgi:hypothetical protein|nr:hypothetical protein [Mucilaginibacter sp.]
MQRPPATVWGNACAFTTVIVGGVGSLTLLLELDSVAIRQASR